MIKGNGKTRAAQSLFRSISDDGIEWLFVILSDDGWVITCNGKRIAVGTGDRTSIGLGVQMFMSLAVGAQPKSQAQCA